MAGPAIVAEQLVKTYGELSALDGIDLEVPQGTVLGLLGPNGSGKTTAVRAMTTLLKPTSGRVEVAGIDVTKDPAQVRQRIGLAGQVAAVDENLTGTENLVLVGRLCGMSTDDARSRARQLLERFDLVGDGERTSKTYSGGMRRRLDLAAAIVDDPEVLFLDEPTTGLDPRSRNDLWLVIQELVADGSTLLLTTQYLEEADRLADSIAVLAKGKVIAQGTAGELKARLGATVIEAGYDFAADAEAAARLVGGIGSVSTEGTTVRLTVEDGPAAMVQLVRTLDAEGLAPAGLSLREPSLDDVFLTLTGESTAGDEQDAAGSQP